MLSLGRVNALADNCHPMIYWFRTNSPVQFFEAVRAQYQEGWVVSQSTMMDFGCIGDVRRRVHLRCTSFERSWRNPILICVEEEMFCVLFGKLRPCIAYGYARLLVPFPCSSRHAYLPLVGSKYPNTRPSLIHSASSGCSERTRSISNGACVLWILLIIIPLHTPDFLTPRT